MHSKEISVLRRRVLSGSVIMGCFLLSGCLNVARGPQPRRRRTYDLPAVLLPVNSNSHLSKEKKTIWIATPLTMGSYNTTEVTTKYRNIEIQALSEAQWASPLHILLHRRITQTVESTNLFYAIQHLDKDIQLRLITRIDHFEYQITRKRCVVAISAKLMAHPITKIIRAKLFRSEVPIPGNTIHNIVYGIGLAYHNVLFDMAEWLSDPIITEHTTGNSTVDGT